MRRWLVLYAVSGACSVAWQVLWVRALTPVFGAGLLAASAVTASFLGGLGLGGWLGDRVLARPGRTYARCEAGVALWGLALPWLLQFVARPVVELLSVAGPLGTTPVRLIAALLLVGPPAVLLGITWPAIVQVLERRPVEAARAYALNTLGAASGALVAGLALPWWLGIRAGSAALSLAQLGVAALAWRLASGEGSGSTPPPSTPVPRSLWVLAASTGALALVGELTWTRLASPLWAARFEGDAEAFAGVLAAVLGGMGLGALFVRRAPEHPERALSGWLGAMALCSVLLLEPVRDVLFGAGPDWRLVEGLLPLAPSVALGGCFPLLAATLLAHGGSRVGALYAVNTLGSVLASLATGFWLLPWLGAQRLLVLLIAVSAALAGMLGRRAWLGLAVLALASLAAVPPVAGSRLLLPDEALLTAVEGRLTTTVVAERADGGERLLVSGGHRIAAAPAQPRSGNDDHALRAQGPAGLHPLPRRVLLIGLGTGETARAFLALDSVTELQVVELDENQPQLLHWFGTEGLLDDPRVSLATEDGRHWLRTHDQTFDVISVDAYGPRTSSAAFYTREFYAEARARLAPGGLVFVKFDPFSIPDEAVLGSYLTALFDTFPDGRLVYVAEGLFGLVGPTDPDALQLDEDRVIAVQNQRAPRFSPVTDDHPVTVPVATRPTREHVEQWWRWSGKPMSRLPWRQVK